MQEIRPDNLNPLDRRRQPKVSKKWMQEDAVSAEIDNMSTGRRGEND
jgi:hypothetical protein